MNTISKIEQEVNQIRLKIHDETKNMTSEQRRERLEKISLEAQRQFGFKRINSVNDNNDR